MAHFKHANTVFPGDRVQIKGQKTAQGREKVGSVVSATDGAVEVRWDSGETTHHELEKLEVVG